MEKCLNYMWKFTELGWKIKLKVTTCNNILMKEILQKIITFGNQAKELQQLAKKATFKSQIKLSKF